MPRLARPPLPTQSSLPTLVRLLTLLGLLLVAPPVRAEGGLTRLEGVVQSLDEARRVVVLQAQGRTSTVWIQASTLLTRAGRPLRLGEVLPGDRWVVEGILLDDGRLAASSVQSQGAPGGAPQDPASRPQQPPPGPVAPLSPRPDSAVSERRPTVQASLPPGTTRWRLWVDGREFTAEARWADDRIVWTPGYDLDAGAHTVRVEGTPPQGAPAHAVWTFTIASGAAGAQLLGYAPAPGSYITVPQPTLSAEFSGPVQFDSLRFSVDGLDFSAQVRWAGNRFSWTAPYPLDPGQHVARAEALGLDGRLIRGEWTFVLEQTRPRR